MTLVVTAVFFDIGNTLASARFSTRLEHLDVYPWVPPVLEQLRDAGLRVGVISNIGDDTETNVRRVLDESGLLPLLDDTLVIFGAKDSPAIFAAATKRLGEDASAQHCLFVGEDANERSVALSAGWRVAPHPRLAWSAANGRRIRYVRFTVPPDHEQSDWRLAIQDLPLVPVHVSGQNGVRVYAIASADAASALDDLGFEVDRLGAEDLPLTSETYLLRDDVQAKTGFLAEGGMSGRYFENNEESGQVLTSTTSGLYVALPAGRSVEQYHFPDAFHGHTLKLLPDMSLVRAFDGDEAPALVAGGTAEQDLSDEEVACLRELSATTISGYLERYVGRAALSSGSDVRIASRHIQHEHNRLVVQALANDLERIGDSQFSVRLHRFSHEGLVLENVEAKLEGELEETVLVTAHLDSTAAFSDGFDAGRDPAPGADDDGSGVAGVLAVAEAVRRLTAAGRPRRTMRFVLFNAEEHGLVGSRAYARDEAAREAPIVAVYQMDMIGYNRVEPRSFEVHIGFWPSQDVQQRSRTLAERLTRAAAQVSPQLPAPQLYQSVGPSPQQRDPAEGRSDHASFHFVGYAACATSEDFFAGRDGDEGEPNPNYHRTDDTFVDADYAADIARAVAGAAWTTSKL